MLLFLLGLPHLSQIKTVSLHFDEFSDYKEFVGDNWRFLTLSFGEVGQINFTKVKEVTREERMLLYNKGILTKITVSTVLSARTLFQKKICNSSFIYEIIKNYLTHREQVEIDSKY